ncbi:hypothetical protein A1O3_03279 [Capronia epimyces CBS 606.96]|uniref:mRNA N(6)-methyladenine demethylase n=1 Tax=Capronia epimyces CBS 606.96 TaxID=1182542 RepID=W9Y1I2_9EURO|nr:uncharacterized protein A1O3_03279 [Capronia epimyces CBS 606.96]EXJ86328.1 hypothetical protein A1O3_03279 [Capronia epimyces CBS 606.96]
MHDAYAKPPDSVKGLFKAWRKCSAASLDQHPEIIDTCEPDASRVTLLSDREVPRRGTIRELEQVFATYVDRDELAGLSSICSTPGDPFEVKALPGLYVFPSLLSPLVQISLLDKLLHRDLSDPRHHTNLHLHYDVCYPKPSASVGDQDESTSSFFSGEQRSILPPKDPAMHKPIDYTQMLETKLRWMTLGGQYDWTNKAYPKEVPPAFPPDIAALLKGLFPEINAQAAIVNLYKPGDTLSVHRDVSEECDQSLISISIGCDAVFIAGNDDGSQLASLRLRSGDAILMSGKSRYAWHAVPKVTQDTCPAWLRDWPDIPRGRQYRGWHGWMANKRINLNVRQMSAA